MELPLNDLLIICLPFLIVLIGNILIHYYYANKQKMILNEISHYSYSVYKDLKLSYNATVSFRWYKADLIILDTAIILFLYNGFFVKQAQPSMLFCKKTSQINLTSILKGSMIELDLIDMNSECLSFTFYKNFILGPHSVTYRLNLNNEIFQIEQNRIASIFK